MTQKVLLIADDEKDNVVIFSAVLTHHGYGVVVAANGQEAVELVRDHSPKLVLMDLRMPVMDGWEATRLLRSDPETANIPIIAVTAEAELSPAQLQEAGFCAYIRKPVLPQDLLGAVEFCLEQGAEAGGWIEIPASVAAHPVAEI